MDGSADSARERAVSYLGTLEEETTRLAWGEISPERRERLVTAAVIFGLRFEEQISGGSQPRDEREAQRLLMRLMSDVIQTLARAENISETDATEFLSDVETRDRVLEMNEVIEAYESHESEGAREDPRESLDALLREAIETRREKAIWSDHWSSG